ncbi:MAG: amino acid amidase [Chloroflexi bacterium RBG_16_54_18]|nr:MAG: amino acid amidase [Chloroflexi bacterium RBG_16_54_18]
MKVFISADIEGITGVTHWNETELGHAEYQAAREQMTAEVVAACEGALEAGAQEIWIKDSHDTGRNLIASRLPREARLIRGWSGHPMMMLQELDSSFQAVLLVGYHSGAGAGKSPLEHTMDGGSLIAVKINDRAISEFIIDLYNTAYHRIPLVFVSGDQGLCEAVKLLNPHIETVSVKEGRGDSTINLHPQLAAELIREGTKKALQGNLEACQVDLPVHFSVEVVYRLQAKAYQFGFFPGAKQVDPRTVQFATDDYFEVLRFFLFAL